MEPAQDARLDVSPGAHATAIGFRPLERADLPRMYRWITTPHVARWWDPAPSLAAVEAHYLPYIDDPRLTQCYAILLDAEPIGFIQTYLIDDYPEYAEAVQVERGAAGVDLFIGEPALVHRGLGPQVLRRFTRTVIFANPDTSCCIIGPAASNAGAIRAYAKAGFHYLKTVAVPGETEPEYLMRLTRGDQLGA